MKIAPQPPPPSPADQALGEFTKESIARVKDFTARKTLEQAHTLAHGLAEVFLAGDAADLAHDLAGAGLGLADAQQIADESAALMKMMAERDRRAELFHAAVVAANEGEQQLYDRLSGFAALLRVKLGARAPALSQLGVPPEGIDTQRCNGRGVRTAPPLAKAIR